MKSRAAVAWKAGEPLSIETIDLEGPKAGEVLVEMMATGICHTDAYTLSGDDPEGISRPSSVMKAPAWSRGRRRRHLAESRRSRHPALHAGMPEVQKLPLAPLQSVHRDPRHQGKGLMPDGTSRFRCDGDNVFHYMGCSTFANYTVLPEIALAKVREDAPFDKICYIGCGVTTGIGAVINTAKVWPGANVAVFGLGGIGLNVIQGARMVGADKIVGIDSQSRASAPWPRNSA